MAHNNDDRALLFDYKSAYEHICNQNISAALEYELQAVNLCDENTNPHLTANICANMGGLYHSTGDVLNAKIYMEKAYHILTENSLQYTADSINQICNYANLAANLGEPEKAIAALKKCTEYTEENSGIYAELLWNTGIIYLQMNDKANAVPHLKKALNIYAEIYEDEPGAYAAKNIRTARRCFRIRNQYTKFNIGKLVNLRSICTQCKTASFPVN